MGNKIWKEMMKSKSLDVQLVWLIDSYNRYIEEANEKWRALTNASVMTDNYKEAVDYNNREMEAQKERYEWLIEWISNNYILKESSIELLKDHPGVFHPWCEDCEYCTLSAEEEPCASCGMSAPSNFVKMKEGE